MSEKNNTAFQLSSGVLVGPSVVQRRGRARRLFQFSTMVAIITLALLMWSQLEHATLDILTSGCANHAKVDVFDWFKVHPSRSLQWHRCYDKFECTRLSVPLDYSEPEGDRAAVALVKLPSKLPPDDERYRGPMLFNPGGPGGSELAGSFREPLNSGVSSEMSVNFTTPSLDIFETKAEQSAWNNNRVPHVNATVDALGIAYGQASVLGQLAKARTRHSAEHVGTPVVARDMLSIIKAHDMALSWEQHMLPCFPYVCNIIQWVPINGVTQQNNVERLISDGVVDADNYYATLWSNNLRDTDGALFNLYDKCVEAGPDACPLHEQTAYRVKRRVDKILDGLKTTPISFYNATLGTYDIVDFSIAKSAIFATLYNTHRDGKKLVLALAELEKGNAQPSWEASGQGSPKDIFECECPAGSAYLPSNAGRGPQTAIACGDGKVVRDDIFDLEEFYGELAQRSSFADVWQMRTRCAGWKIKAKERFTRSRHFSSVEKIKTSHPILLIGNTLDPVTPLWNAHKMSAAFEDSVVLTQKSPGHCSLAATSLCTAKHIREYFRNGTMPPTGTICNVESSIFGGPPQLNTWNAEDQELIRALDGLHQNFVIPSF
ncbi:hypothetical protein BD410DRAFT_833037 [Rickenella mellea]|uniref:Peptidase S33 tripeptidyl aminopeptidase-like C-terminal domain-containing protein n=1 Tax=Rickenella mellea TaxID=50990 RepID=A0A4Y7PHH2_9AGAM|nr:hypothetical protein BD410DRAFT_833037 [Rickenella mellea]